MIGLKNWTIALVWSAVLAGAIFVIDGDTIEQDGVQYRVLGYDAPEIKRVQCPEERELGIKCADRLIGLIRECGATIELPGTKSKCGFNRPCAILKVGGKDVKDRMIDEGCAVHYKRGDPKPSWCPPTVVPTYKPQPGC